MKSNSHSAAVHASCYAFCTSRAFTREFPLFSFFLFLLLLFFHIVEGWLHRGCQKWSLAVHPTATLEIWDNNWRVGRSWEMGLQREKLGAFLHFTRENWIFPSCPEERWPYSRHEQLGGMFLAFWHGNQKAALTWPPWCLPVWRGRKLWIGKYWALCKYFAPLRCQWQILCGILCVRWWFCDGKKTGELFKYRSCCEKSLKNISWISFPKPFYPTS